jgi:hypothetical protein
MTPCRQAQSVDAARKGSAPLCLAVSVADRVAEDREGGSAG